MNTPKKTYTYQIKGPTDKAGKTKEMVMVKDQCIKGLCVRKLCVKELCTIKEIMTHDSKNHDDS